MTWPSPGRRANRPKRSAVRPVASALGIGAALAIAGVVGAARADEASASSRNRSGAGSFGALSGDWLNASLLGDLGGLRPALAKYGITLQLFEEAETFGNLSGGVRQGVEANGVTTAQLQLDTQPVFGLVGGLFNVSGFHIWGGELSASNLLNLQTVSGLEANASVRLWELWYQQTFGQAFDLKLGAQSVDEEFMISRNSAYFLNAAMGWPELPAANLPAGGPAYPLAGLGVRARAHIGDAVTIMAGVFNGSPIPLNSPNSQTSNPNGLSFPLNTGFLAIAELQFTYPTPNPWGKSAGSGPLPGAYKIGAWYDSLDFDDQQVGGAGVPLASPESDGIPAKKKGNFAVYAVADQTLWRAADPNRNISAFIRPTFTTLQDRNLISFSLNGGLTFREPIVGRANDTLGLGFGVARISGGAANDDRRRQSFEPDVFTPVRTAETFFEATYQVQVLPSSQIQPDIQYIINPGGGVANPDQLSQKIKNEWVLGLRTNITF